MVHNTEIHCSVNEDSTIHRSLDKIYKCLYGGKRVNWHPITDDSEWDG